MSLSIDRIALVALLAACAILGTQAWLRDHPQHNPWAPLNLDHPPGWATARKLAALRGSRPACLSFLERSGIEAVQLEPAGEGACRRDDRLSIGSLPAALVPARAEGTCAIDAGLAWWLRHGVQPQAEAILGSRVVRIEHLGTANCRRIGGGEVGDWSEHATGNAIDISGFVLADGRRISVQRGWLSRDAARADPGETGDKARFLRGVRDEACTAFATVLSPDYNEAHADHFHLDQARRAAGWKMCR